MKRANNFSLRKKSTKTPSKSLNRVLTEHALWLKTDGLVGTQANLPDASLGSVNLSGANLRFANFQRAWLVDVDFSKADLRGANFSSAILTGANLRGAQLSQTDFGFADLSHTNLVDVSFESADFYMTNLANARLARIQGVPLSMHHCKISLLNLILFPGWDQFMGSVHIVE